MLSVGLLFTDFCSNKEQTEWENFLEIYKLKLMVTYGVLRKWCCNSISSMFYRFFFMFYSFLIWLYFLYFSLFGVVIVILLFFSWYVCFRKHIKQIFNKKNDFSQVPSKCVWNYFTELSKETNDVQYTFRFSYTLSAVSEFTPIIFSIIKTIIFTIKG